MKTVLSRNSRPFSGTFGERPTWVAEYRPPESVARAVRRILVPIDFSENSQAALQYAVETAGQLGAEVALVHVVEDLPYTEGWMSPRRDSDFEPTSRRLREELREMGRGHDCVAEPIVRVGHAGDEIVAAAREVQADLIILSSQGYTGRREMLLGGVAERVLHHAPCPVLVVKTKEAPSASERDSRGG